jgi:hypothetical protein
MAVQKPKQVDGFGQELEYDDATETYSPKYGEDSVILTDNLLKRVQNGKFWKLRAAKGYAISKSEFDAGIETGSLVYESDHARFYAELTDEQRGQLKVVLRSSTEPFNINRIVSGNKFDANDLVSKGETPFTETDQTATVKTDTKADVKTPTKETK